MNIAALLEASKNFSSHLQTIKDANPPSEFTWYGYDILSNFIHLEKLLTGDNRNLFEWVKDRPIVDIGAADGDLSYFLESLDFRTEIIDWPATNWNGLRGAHQLKQLLDSKVVIHEMDLDSYFNPPESNYGLVVLLGILYHLKNPYYVLEKLATMTEYCLISTRIARFTADKKVPLADASVAYLLDPEECNNDATNFWILSMAGLEKLVKRTRWEIVDSVTVGDTNASDPSSPEHDERAFMLLKSTYA